MNYLDNYKWSEVEKEILVLCIPSDEVRNYQTNLPLEKLAEVICGAQIPIEKKIYFMDCILKHTVSLNEKNHFNILLNDMREAYKLVDEKEVNIGIIYTLSECWYDEDIKEHKNELVGVYDKIVSVKRYIKAIEAEENKNLTPSEIEEIRELPSWWEVQVWRRQESTAKIGFIEYGTFYLLHDVPIWFDKTMALMSIGHEKDYDDYFKKFVKESWPFLGTSYCLRTEFLKLPLPFKPGTIVEINTYPFGPKTTGVIIAYADLKEDVMTLVRNYKGMLEVINVSDASNLGHFSEQEDFISPLYRLRTTETDNEKDRAIFSAVASYISENQDRGEYLLKHLAEKEYKDEDLFEIVRKL